MWHIILDELHPVAAVEVGDFDDVHLCVSPVDLAALDVESESVRPAERRIDEHDAIRAVQRGAFYLGLLSPVRPVHVAATDTRGTLWSEDVMVWGHYGLETWFDDIIVLSRER